MMHYKGLAKLAAKEAKNRALLICETAGMLSLLGEKWAYSAQVESLQQSDGRELLAEIVRMVGRIPTEEAVTVRGSTEQHTMLDVTLARLSEAMQVDGAREIKATPLMYGSTMLWQTRDRQIIGLPEDAQAANDFENKCVRFEKKLHDLELTRMVSIQMGPQTRLLQNNDTQMIEKIQSSLVNTIPLWKNQMVLALGMEHSRQATAAQNAVTEMTNQLLRKNADTLKMGTIATAKEAERSIVDIETLQHTNEQLISTLDEVARIQKEGAEVELGRIEGELKQKLLELRG